MPNTHLSQSTSRRDLAGLLRGSRTRKHARLRHRLLQAERLEDRRLLAAISGQVFNDLKRTGSKNSWRVGPERLDSYLDGDGNGQLGTGEISTTTAAKAVTASMSWPPGTYNVAEVQQLGWHQPSPVGPFRLSSG